MAKKAKEITLSNLGQLGLDGLDLNCCICFDIPNFRPVFQCVNGHIYCKDCFPKVGRNCGVCRVDLVPGNRNVIAERLIENLPKRCKYYGNILSDFLLFEFQVQSTH